MTELLQRYPSLKVCKEQIEKVVSLMVETYNKGGKILLCGNGGSCADCEHIVGELMKGFLLPRRLKAEDRNKIILILGEDHENFCEKLQYGIPAISLPNEVAVNTAFINDVSGEMVYAQLVYGYGVENDLLIGISTSGNSKNVVNAVKAAKVKGMRSVGLTGSMPCKLDDFCDVTIKVPETETYKIQEYHLPVYHYICGKVEEILFGDK